MTKRIFDILISSVSLVIFSPVLLIVSAGILITDPGPIFYRADRIGLNGRRFVMHKFRTMHVRADQGSAISSENDPRVFGFGRLLRKAKLDELPQLWDVLRGEMAIVGPRPEDPDIVAKFYTAEFLESLVVKPGLTSPGSLYYYSHAEELLLHGTAESDYAEHVLPRKMALDLEYVEKNSVSNDIGIVFQTVMAILVRPFK